MLANLLVALGVLVLLHSASTYLLPNLHARTWRRTTSGVTGSPTTEFSSSPWNTPKNFDGSQMTQPSIVARPVVGSNSPPKHIILNTLKTGMKLDGYVVSSTPYAAFIDAGVVRVSKGGSFSPVHAMLHKSDIPKEVLNSLRKGQHQFPSPIPGPGPLLPKNTPLSVFVKEVTKQTGRFTVTTDSTVTREDLSQEHLRVREEASERRRSRRLRRQLEDLAPGTTAEGIVDKVVDEGVLVTVTSLGSLNVTGLIRKKDMPQHLKVPEAIKVSHQNQLLQQDFTPGRPVTCAVSEVHPTPHTANVYNLKLTFEGFNGPVDDDEPVEDIFDTMTAKEQKAWLMNRRVEDLNDDEQEEEDNYDNEDDNDQDQEEDNNRDDFEQDFGNFDQEVTELFEELLAASVAQHSSKGQGQGKPNPARLLPVESVYEWDAVQDMISSGEIEKADVDQAIRKAGVPLRGGTLSLAQFKDVVEGLQDTMYADEEEDDYGSDDEEEDVPVSRSSRTGTSDVKTSPPQKQKHGKREGNVDREGEKEVEEEDEYDEYSDDEDENEGYDMSYDDDDDEEDEDENREQDNYDSDDEDEEEDDEEDDENNDDQYNENDQDGENEEEEQSFDEIVTEVFDELRNDQNLVPVAAFKAWEDVQDMIEGGVIRKETLDLLINEVMKSTPTGSKNKSAYKQKSKKMAEPALTFEQFDQLVRLLDEMVNAQEAAEDRDDREEVKNTRVQVRGEEEEEDDGENYDDGEEEEGEDGEDENLSEEEQDAIDAADAQEAFQELSKDGKVVTMKSLRAWDEIRDLLEEEILDQESLDVLIRTANGDLTSPMNLETFTDLLALINDAVSSVEGEDDGEFADYDDAEEDEEENVSPRSTNNGRKVAASVDEREAVQRTRSQAASQEEEQGEEEEEEGEEEPSDEELEVLARQAFNELLPRGRSTVPVRIFESWPSVQEEVTAGMLTNDEIRYVLKKVDPRNTHQLTFEQFTTAMDMLEMKIQERAEEMEQQELDEAQNDDAEAEDEEDENQDYDEDDDEEEEGDEGYGYDEDEEDHYAEDLDEYDDIDDEEPISPAATARALPSTTTSTSSTSSPLSAKSTTPVSNNAASVKSVPSGPGVGFDQVTLPATKATPKGTPAAVKKNKKSDDAEVVQVPTSLEDTEKEIDQLMEEMTQALYDELRGEDAVLTVEKLKQWQELQDIFNEGVVSKSFFDRAVKAAGASHTGPIDWKQFGAVLDAVQAEAEKSYPDEDEDDADGTEDTKAKEAHAKALLKVQEKAARAQKTPTSPPSAAAVAASLDEEGTRKNDNYDFTKVFETLEELEQKQTGKRKSKKTSAASASPRSAAPAAPPAASDITYDQDAQDEQTDEEEYPVEPTVDELAQETYDRLRGAQAQPTVADLLHWEDIVELIDRRALTGEQLVQALTDAKIDTSKENEAVSLEQFYDAVRHIDQHIDFSKLQGPDLSRFDQSNMIIHGAGGEIDELLREQAQDSRSGGTTAGRVASSVSDIGDGTDDEPRETPAPTKRKSKTTTTTQEKPTKEKVTKAASKITKPTAESVPGAETSAPVSGLPVEVVSEAAPVGAEQGKEKVKKPRKSKKATPVVLDTVTVEDGPANDLEIKEMNLDYHLRELNLPASGQIDYPVFEKFVRQLDEVLIDEKGDFLPPDQKHRAVNLEGVAEI